MTVRTRYFVVASLLVLVVGLGTGLVAYFVGLPQGVLSSRGGPEELKYVPKTATIVAYANVQDVMHSEMRRRLRAALPNRENGQREFQNETGIDIEKDIDHVVAFLASEGPGGSGGADEPEARHERGSGMVLARGRFDQAKIEGLLRDRGAEVQEYKGRHLYIATDNGRGARGFGLVFLEPGLAALGSADLLRTAVDLGESGDNVTSNEDLMDRVRTIEAGHNAWAVGRFDAVRAEAKLPDAVESRLPPISWVSVGTHIDDGISGSLQAETRDAAAAANLRDVLRGFLALAKMQTASRPELQTVVESLQIGGENDTVSLSFAVPAPVFDLIGRTDRTRKSPVQ
jgi:hypothetical protein